MNVYINNVCISEDCINRQKKCTTTTSSLLTQNIYYNSSWFYKIYQNPPFYCCICWCSLFVGILILNLTCINIEALFIFHYPIQIFWNHTDVVDRICIIYTSLNKVGTFGSPSRNSSFSVPLVLICAFFDFNYSCVMHGGMPLIPFPVTPRVSNFSLDCMLSWKRRLSCIDYTLRIDGVFPHSIKKGMRWKHPLIWIVFV